MPNLLRWFVDLAKEMDRGMGVMRGGEKAWREPEVLMEESGVLVRMGLPGVEPGDVDLMISDGGALVISGITRTEHDGKKVYNLEDIELDSFREVVNLPAGYEGGEARATFAGGVLEVRVEQSETGAEARRLGIENA